MIEKNTDIVSEIMDQEIEELTVKIKGLSENTEIANYYEGKKDGFEFVKKLLKIYWS